MTKISTNKIGVALLIALGTVIIVSLLGLVLLRPLASHGRLSHHQVSRIQAYYAALAGMNYAYDRLRVGDPNWPIPTSGNSYTHDLRCQSGVGCAIDAGEIDEVNFPHTIRSVLITVAFAGETINNPYTSEAIPGCSPCSAPTGIPACICTAVDYTYIE